MQALWEWRAGDRGRSREEVERTIVKMLRRRGHELGSHPQGRGSPENISRQGLGSQSCSYIEGGVISSEVTSGITDRPKEALGQSCSLSCSDEDKGIWKEGPWKKGVHQKRVRASIRSPP